MWSRDKFVEHYEYDVKGTPCEPVIQTCRVSHVEDLVLQLFPDDPDLAPCNWIPRNSQEWVCPPKSPG